MIFSNTVTKRMRLVSVPLSPFALRWSPGYEGFDACVHRRWEGVTPPTMAGCSQVVRSRGRAGPDQPPPRSPNRLHRLGPPLLTSSHQEATIAYGLRSIA